MLEFWNYIEFWTYISYISFLALLTGCHIALLQGQEPQVHHKQGLLERQKRVNVEMEVESRIGMLVKAVKEVIQARLDDGKFEDI